METCTRVCIPLWKNYPNHSQIWMKGDMGISCVFCGRPRMFNIIWKLKLKVF